MKKLKQESKKLGVSLIELLVTIGVISILIGIMGAFVINGKELSKRTKCISNLRQMAIASIMYSGDDRHGSFTGTFHDGSDDVNWMYPNYLDNVESFNCPSTKNFVRKEFITKNEEQVKIVDLGYLAVSKGKSTGISYEVFGFMGINSGQQTTLGYGNQTRIVEGVKKTVNNVQTYRHKRNAFNLLGAIPGASSIIIFLDGDDLNTPNFPTESGNHGEKGVNVSFADGHVDWVEKSEFVYVYELSQDEGRVKQ